MPRKNEQDAGRSQKRAAKRVKPPSRPRIYIRVERDAISRHNYRYRSFVERLSQLDEQQFRPFEKKMEQAMEVLPVRTQNAILAIGFRKIYVNYLFADDFKIMGLPRFGRKTVCDFGIIRQQLIDFVVERLSSGEHPVREVSSEPQPIRPLEEILGQERYSILERAVDGALRELSQRARDSVMAYQGDFIEDFIHQGKSLQALTVYGRRKSCDELAALIRRMRDLAEDFLEHTDQKGAHAIVARTLQGELGELKYALLRRSLKNLSEGLSPRASRSISSYHGDFIEDFVHQGKDVLKLNQIGKKTALQVSALVKKLRETTSRLALRELSPLDMKLVEYRLMFDDCYDRFAREFYTQKGHMPMFHILENLIRKNLLFKTWMIMDCRHPLLGDEPTRCYDEVAKKFSLTRERVRQICYQCEAELNGMEQKQPSSPVADYSKIISCTGEWGYAVEALSQGRDMIQTADLLPLLKEENCVLSMDVAFLAMSLVMKKEFALVGREPVPLTGTGASAWKNYYLIRRELGDLFRFDEICPLLEETEASLSDDTPIDAAELVRERFSKAWNGFYPEKLERVVGIVKEILKEEYGMLADEQGRFLLQGKKRIVPGDFIYETLMKLGDPMSIDELFERYDALRPGAYKSPSSLKAFVTRDPRLRWIGIGTLVGLA